MKNKIEARKMVNWDEVEEITEEEYSKRKIANGDFYIRCENGYLFFKPKQKFPITYEGDDCDFGVNKNGSIDVIYLGEWKVNIGLKKTLEALDKARAKAKELREE